MEFKHYAAVPKHLVSRASVGKLELELDGDGAVEPVFIARYDGHIHAHALIFETGGRDGGTNQPLPHFRIAIEAACNSPQTYRTDLPRLVVDTA
jgi:hypothetical protein